VGEPPPSLLKRAQVPEIRNPKFFGGNLLFRTDEKRRRFQKSAIRNSQSEILWLGTFSFALLKRSQVPEIRNPKFAIRNSLNGGGAEI